MPFDLHPEYPPEGVSRNSLEARYGEGFSDHVRRMIEAAGLAYGPPERIPRSVASLQLGEIARDAGRFDELHPVLFRAYWAEGRDIGDIDTLGDIAKTVGLDGAAARAALADGRHLERIHASTQAAYDAGVSGVPAWVVNDRFVVPGAQPHELFEQVLERLGVQPVGA